MLHGKVLEEMTKDIRHLKCADLGCGNKAASIFFDDYTGFDLPEFNVYVSDLDFIREYDVVLMNAFIDVMQFPLEVLDLVLPHCRNYVIIHRQEFTKGVTKVTQENAYGGWTYHSIINNEDFVKTILNFRLESFRKLDFDNWEDGGASILLKRV